MGDRIGGRNLPKEDSQKEVADRMGVGRAFRRMVHG